MSCIHEMALGMHRGFALADGTPGPCIACENDRLEAVASIAKKIVSIGGTQSKLGKVYLRELAAALSTELPGEETKP